MKKKNHIKVRFSTILLCIPAILLCTAPCGGATFGIDYDDGGVHYVTVDEINVARGEDLGEGGLDWLHVWADTTVNLYADVSQYVLVHPGGVLNIYSGSVGLYVVLSTGEPKPIVTVYGTDFAMDGELLDPSATQFTVDSLNGGVLTGFYVNGDSGPISLKFLSDIPINLELPAVSKVAIDIKPGGNPNNNINPRSKGVVPVAVLTTEDFDAGTIDPDTVEFAGAKPVRWKLCDVDGDGNEDMLFHFKTQELFEKDLNEDSTEAMLTGTADGNEISGTDRVWIVPRRK